MQALVLNAVKDPPKLVERPEPKPARGQAVVRLQASALNRRDFWITRGLYPGIVTPVTLGSDGAGIVKSVGVEVDANWRHREVLINPGLDWGESRTAQASTFHILGMPTEGAFAEEVAVPACQLHAKPSHLNMREAAALPLAGVTAYRAVFTQGGLQPGENVLVTGVGGGVATFAVQYSVAAGATVWVTSSSPHKIQQAVRLGAQGGFDYRNPGWAKELFKQSEGVDLVIDGAAGAGYADLIDAVRPGGRIVNYGATAGPPERLDMFKVFWKQLRLVGTTMGSPADFAAMIDFVNRHRLTPVIDATFPLAEADRAFERMRDSSQFGKLVLEID